VRHVLSAFVLTIRQLSRLARPEAIRELSLATESLTVSCPNGPCSSWPSTPARTRARRGPARPRSRPASDWPGDRGPTRSRAPDWWNRAARCADQNLLRPVDQRDWLLQSIVPGTSRLVTGPWQKGVPASGPVLVEAARRAPWSPALAQTALLLTYHGEVPSAAVLEAYGKLLEYDVWAMRAAIADLHDADDTVQALAERACDSDVELCAGYAEHLSVLGRGAAAEKMWRRAVAGARDRITLSNSVGGYVEQLLDQGNTREALRIARLAANVYSAQGLFTLALARERLQEFDEAARLYAAITERYQDKRSRTSSSPATASGTPTAAWRRRRGARWPSCSRTVWWGARWRTSGRPGTGAVSCRRTQPGRRLAEDWRSSGDFLVGLDGWAVGSWDQLNAIVTFTDEPRASVVVLRAGAG